MPVADFFDKAALAVSQVAQGLNYDSLLSLVETNTIAIAFDSSAISSPEGTKSLNLLVNLSARLYPSIELMPLDDPARSYVGSLIKLSKSINRKIEITTDRDAASFIVVIGETRIDTEKPVRYVGSNGWIARLSNTAPIGSGSTDNPFGAGAAACMATANIFRFVFEKYIEEGALDDEFSLSLLDYSLNAVAPSNPEITSIDFGECCLVGLGAIGNGFIWALGRTKGVRGILHLIDDEKIDLSNLQRYVLTTRNHVDRLKVNVAGKELSSSVRAIPHRQKWGEFLRQNQNWHLERVAVAVDSAEDRQSIQASLPKWIANSWTQSGDLGISRHVLTNDDACLTCLYFPDEKGRNLDELVAAALGLPDALMEIRVLLHNNCGIGRDLLERVSTSLNVPIEPLLQFEGVPLYQFYVDAICGGIVLKLKDGAEAGNKNAPVPLAFQSAMAGIMLAAELVADAGRLRKESLPTTTRIDLLHPLGSYLNQPAVKHPSGQCICQDVDYLNVYRKKYRL